MTKTQTRNKAHQRLLVGSMVLAVGASGAMLLSSQVNAAETTKPVQSGVQNKYFAQTHGSTVEYGGLKYSVVSKYVAQNHEAVSWEMRMLVGTKASQVGIFTDQLQPGQYFYTGATPNHYILTDDEWQKAVSQQDTYADLPIRIGTRYLDDKSNNGQDLQTGSLHYIAPEFLDGLKLDDKMAKAGGLADPKKPLTVAPQSDDSALIKSGYKQGDTDKTTVDKSQIQQLMSLVKTQAVTAENNVGTDTEPAWSPSGDSDKGTKPSADVKTLGEIGVKEGPNGFYTYDAKTRQLKFVVYNLERVKADSEIIASVIKSLGGQDKVETLPADEVAKAAEEAGVPSDIVASLKSSDAVVASDDNTLLALNFTNLYMHDVRIMIPMAVEAGNVIPNQYDFAGATWDGKTLGDVPAFEVSDKPKVLVPGTKVKPADPDKPFKNVLAGDSLTLQNGYNYYGKADDDKINADDQDDAKSAEASFTAGAPLMFSKDGDYVVKEHSSFAPGVYIVRTLDGKAINAAADGTVLQNGQLLSVTAGSKLTLTKDSGKFQLVDATSAFAKVASAQAVAKIGDGKKSKVVASDEVKGKDATIDAMLAASATSDTKWTWVVSQPVPKNMQNIKGADIKLIDDLAQDKLVSLKIVDTANPTKVIADVTDDAKKALSENDKTVADGLKDGKEAKDITDGDGQQLSKNLLIYRLKDYTAAKYGDTVSFAITVSGSSSTDHKDTASTQLFTGDKPVTKTPQSTNTVKVVTSQPKTVVPTNPVQPDASQDPKTPGTPVVEQPQYIPAGPVDGGGTPLTTGRVNTPVSEALGDIANSPETADPVKPLAATGAYIASNLWFLVLFPIAVAGSVAEFVYKKKTGHWFTVKSLKQLFAAK